MSAAEATEHHRLSRPVEVPAKPVSEALKKVDGDVDESIIIPGNPEQLARETAQLSPEGRPADPKVGPRGLWLEVGVGVVILIAFAVGLSIWVNPLAGAVVLVLGTLALVLNPVVGATSQRADEREQVLAQHRSDDPDAVVIRTTSKRKERRLSRSA